MEFLARISLSGVMNETMFTLTRKEFIKGAFVELSRKGANTMFMSWLLEYLGGHIRYHGTEAQHDSLVEWQMTLFEVLPIAEHITGNILQLLSVAEEYFTDMSAGASMIAPHLLIPDFWQNEAFSYGACRFISSILHKNGASAAFGNQLSRMSEISKVLLKSKNYEHVGYYFLENLIPFFVKHNDIDDVTKSLLMIFSRLTSNRTLKRILDSTRLISISFIVSQNSGVLTSFLQKLEYVQPGILKMIIQSLYSTCAQSASEFDKKLHTVAFCAIIPHICTVYSDYLIFTPPIIAGLISEGSNRVQRACAGSMYCAPPTLFSVSVDSYLEPIQYFVTCATDWNNRGVLNIQQFIESIQSNQRDRILNLMRI